jgi:hypothetical protein
LLDAGAGIIADLQSGSVAGLVGAAQKAATTYNTFKGKNLRSIAQAEAVSLGKDTINKFGPDATRAVTNKADGWVFPNAVNARAQQSLLTTSTTPLPGGA